MRLLLLLSLLGLAACTSLNTIGPSATVESPEIAQKAARGRPAFYLRSEPNLHFHFADDIAARPLKIKNPPELEPTGDLNLGLRFVPAERFQLSGGLSPAILNLAYGFQFSGRLTAQYQFLGESYEENSASGWISSIFSHLNYGTAHKSGNQKDFWGEGGYPWSGEGTFRGIDAGLSLGYRINAQNLIFVGLSHENFDVEAHAKQGRSDDGQYPEAEITIDRTDGYSDTAAAGWSWGRKNRLDLVYSYSKNHWGNLKNDQHFLSVGFAVNSFLLPAPTVEPN